MFRCASETLLEIAADPKHLGARIGVLAVLHTWSQKLTLHPHVHCIVTGGGLSDWRSLLQSLTGINPLRCEACGQNTLHLIEDLAPAQSPRAPPR